MRKLAYEEEAPYCFSRNLLRKVARPAMTEEKLHCASTRRMKRGLRSSLRKIFGNPTGNQEIKCISAI